MADRPIAFVCAMPMELEPLARAIGLVASDVDGQTVHTGRVDERPVVGIVTGMGTRHAADAVEHLLDHVAIAHVLVVGIAGAGMADVPIGTLVLPEVVVHGPSGREHRPIRVGDADHAGHLWTDDELITRVDDLIALHERGVVALDMETAAIAHVCEQRDVPWSVFRAISDRSRDGLVDADVLAMSNLDNTPNVDAITAYFEQHPDAAETLAQMGADATKAADNAAAAAIAAIAHL